MKQFRKLKVIVYFTILILSICIVSAQNNCNWLIAPDEDLLQYFDLENSSLIGCGADINIGVINPLFPARETISELENSGKFILHPDQVNNWSGENSNLQTSEIIQAVHSLAPDANILFYRLSSADDFLTAANWMQSENANIIINLVTHPLFEQQDLEAINLFMDSALENNILWLNSAGNYGNSYYEGAFDDSVSTIDGWHSFQTDDNGLLPVQPVDTDTDIRVYLLWEQEQTELDLFALASADNLGDFVEISTRYLDQESPATVITIPAPIEHEVYIAAVNSSFFQENDDPLSFRVFVSNGIIQLPFEVSGNSIPSPNDNPNVLTIGAEPSDTALLASSSSLAMGKPETTSIGITHEGELSSGVATAVVAGIAARMWSLDTTQTATDIHGAILENRAGTTLVIPRITNNSMTYLAFGAVMVVIAAGGYFVFKHIGRQGQIEELFEQIEFETKFTDDMREMLVILRMPFNQRGYPKLAEYFASIRVDMIFEARLSGSPNLSSPLLDVSGSDSVAVNFFQGLLTVGREKSHPALVGFHFTPNNQISFDLYFKHMLPSSHDEPAIVWYLSDLKWSDDKLSRTNIRFDISTSRNKFSKELSVTREGVLPSENSKSNAVEDNIMHRGRVFISYRSTQRDFTRKLTLDLRQQGLRIWMDAEGGIPIGADWEHTIEQTIDDAETIGMIAVLSPAYVSSRNCLRELRRADRRSKKMFIVPVLLEKLEFEQMPMNVQDIQYIDFTVWEEQPIYEKRLDELVSRLRSLIDLANKE